MAFLNLFKNVIVKALYYFKSVHLADKRILEISDKETENIGSRGKIGESKW